MIWMLLKRGTGSGERGTEVWERVVSGNLHKNPKWRSKKRERERRRQRKEFVPWLKSGGDEIANQSPSYVYVLSRWYVFSIFNLFHLPYGKVLGLSFRDTWNTHITPGLLRLL